MKGATGLSATDLRETMVVYADHLRDHQQSVNRLNVYPVPDGDTGTNMMLTLRSVVAELEALGDAPAMSEVCKAVSHGSLMGARGNSGVILSQLLRGVADRLAATTEAGGDDLADALVQAGELARRAVVRPVEGTILTVARVAGTQARMRSREGGTLVEVAESARRGAEEALATTPDLLPVLKEAGVVDAGGAGYLLLFDALLNVLDGRQLPTPAEPVDPTLLEGAADRIAGTGLAGLRYEVMYLLEAPDETISAFREVWAGIGDSIVVVGGEGIWNCHIHTDDIGPAIEAALDAGRPRDIRVTDLLEQVEEERWVREGAGAPPDSRGLPTRPPATTEVVAVVTGEGIGRIFRSLGVHHQVVGGQTMNPSTAQLLEAVEAAPTQQVVILPNNENIRPVAEQVDGLTTKSVSVVPTGSIVEGFAALLAYDPEADLDANRRAMARSAERVEPAEVTQAVRSSGTPVGPVRRGGWMGMSRRGVTSIGSTVVEAACGVLGALIGPDHELITLIEGEGATPADTRRITEWLHEDHPEVSIEVHHGGQPLYPYLFGIE